MPTMPSTSDISPAIASITSVNVVLASDRSYNSCIVLTEASERLPLIDHAAEKTLRAGTRTPEDERDQPVDIGRPGTIGVLAEGRPVDDGRRRLIDAVVVDIAHDADDFLPRRGWKCLETLAD